MNYAYERISTIKQDERRQELSLNGYKIDKKFLDKMTGKTSDRPELNKLKLIIKPGDNIYCESISRLGRNVDDLRKLVEYFVSKEVNVHFIKEGFNTKGNMYKFMLTILGAVAEMEREIIVERVKEGIQKAKEYGTKSGKPIGHPGIQLHKDFEKYYNQWTNKEIKSIEFARLIGINRTGLYRHINFYRENKMDLKQQDSKPEKCLIKAKDFDSKDTQKK
jgi:DNA invertase Pin-like site-specific DNA recombinase